VLTRVAAIAIAGISLILAACGGGEGSPSKPADGTSAPAGGGDAGQRLHSRYLISEFEKNKDAAARQFGGKMVTFEGFVDRHGTNDDGTYVRVKSEPYASRFIYCYYDSSQEAAIEGLNPGVIVFLTARIGEFQDVFLSASECSVAQPEGGTGGDS
jgi:hypothetical protein